MESSWLELRADLTLKTLRPFNTEKKKTTAVAMRSLLLFLGARMVHNCTVLMLSPQSMV